MSASRAIIADREIDPVEIPLFGELLTRISRFRSLSNHAYAGMSGFAVDDQRKLYHTLGIRRMMSFDPSTAIVSRQRFNKPIFESRFRRTTLEEFASGWSQAFIEEGLEEAGNYILWIRGGDADEIGREARHFQQMVGALPEDGLARITLRVDYDSWTGPLVADGRRRTVKELHGSVAERLRGYLGDYLQESDYNSSMGPEGLSRLLAKAFGTAGGMAVPGNTGLTFEPLSVVRYGAPTSFVTVSGMVLATGNRALLRSNLCEGDWPFASSSWTEVADLRFPDLTSKERIELETLGNDRAAARARLGFDLDEATGEVGLFDSFVRFHRFLPATVAADL